MVANLKSRVMRPFEREWFARRLERGASDIFPTIKAAIKAFEDAQPSSALVDASPAQGETAREGVPD